MIAENSHWFAYTMASTIIYGVINFTYKAAAVHKLPSHNIINISAATVTIISFVLIIVFKSEFVNWQDILFFAGINSAFFGLGSIVKIQSLRYIPTSFAFPVGKLNSVLLIIYAIFLFGDSPTFREWSGIVLSFAVLAFISLNIRQDAVGIDKKLQYKGLLFALLGAVATSFSMLAGKYASSEVPKLNYIFVSYGLVFIYTTIIGRTFYRKDKSPKSDKKKIFYFGLIAGVLNFGGYFLVLMAFETGPLSLIQGISSNAFIIPVILSVWVFKEKFTVKNAIVIVLSIISILLIKL